MKYILPIVILIWCLFYLYPIHPPRIGFGFLVHDHDTLQGFKEFITHYYSPNHDYFIHFDKKINKESFDQPNIHVIDQQIKCNWGKYSLLFAQLLLLKSADSTNIDYFYFLDGMTVPLRPLRDLESFLSELDPNTSQLFDDYPIPTCKYNWPECTRTKARCENSNCTRYDITPNHAPIYKYSQWVMLSKPFISYMFTNQKWLTDWIQFFKHTTVPDESFFHTIIMDSPFKNDQIYGIPVYTRWHDCLRYSKRKNWSPCWLLKDDYVDVMTSDRWFARKIAINSGLRSILWKEIK
eukprot:NODE_72_length_24857_cov_0.454399.p8 type:complete len:294 gc:universal NODE_72_length_24857_cov_0.454399:9221-8340(-)